jgi:hypothetical protein
MSQQSSGGVALRFGALVGLGWGVLLVANYYLVQVQDVRFTTAATLVLSLVVYLVAGILAAARTGAVSTGLLAGLWAGLFSSLLNGVGVVAILLTDHALVEKARQAAQQAAQRVSGAGGHVPPITDNLIIVSSVASLVFGAVIATVVGLGLGALGGAIGRSRAPAPQLHQEAPFPQWQTPGASPPPPDGGR